MSDKISGEIIIGILALIVIIVYLFGPRGGKK